MTLFEELKARGLVAQTTNEEKIAELINTGKAIYYTGYDPTADSLHVGHFLQLIVMRHLQRAGNRPIVLIGGGTTMVGDPSGRTDLRQMMTQQQIAANGERFKGQIGRFLDFSEGKAMMVNNADWLLELNYIDFLREVGTHFSVNRMLTAECFKSRLERGLSFIEFNYMLMQSYDYLVLHQKYGCNLQCGGDDQWSNILSGADLVRRKTGDEVYGVTFTLLLTSTGTKMGKTQSGAVWLDPEKTSPFEFYQYWRNVDDADVINCLRMLTFLPLEEIAAYEKMEGSQLNGAKEVLAFELTALVHSKEAAEKAREASRALFADGGVSENMPTSVLSADQVPAKGIGVLGLLTLCSLIPSRSEGRRLVTQGGLELGGERIASLDHIVSRSDLEGEGLIIKKGKKTYHRAKLG